ncbi:hypothetical protein HDU93_003919, partial [Gonapodya sp. JEL0774]
MLAAGGRKGVEIWDTRVGNGKRVHLLRHRDAVVTCDWDALGNGDMVAAGSLDKVVKIWDLRSLRSHPPIPLPTDPTSLNLSPHRLLVAHRGALLAYHPTSFEPLRTIEVAGGGAEVMASEGSVTVVSPGWSPRCEWVDVGWDGENIGREVGGVANLQVVGRDGEVDEAWGGDESDDLSDVDDATFARPANSSSLPRSYRRARSASSSGGGSVRG